MTQCGEWSTCRLDSVISEGLLQFNSAQIPEAGHSQRPCPREATAPGPAPLAPPPGPAHPSECATAPARWGDVTQQSPPTPGPRRSRRPLLPWRQWRAPGRAHVWRCRHELPRALRRLGAARRGQGDARQGEAGAGTALRNPRPHPPPPSPLCVRPAGAAQRGGAEGSHRGGAGQAGVSRGSGRDSPPLPGSARAAAAARRARPLREPGRGHPWHGEAHPGAAGPVRGAAAAGTSSSWRHRAEVAWRPAGLAVRRANGGTSHGGDPATVVDVRARLRSCVAPQLSLRAARLDGHCGAWSSLELLFPPTVRIKALGL